MSEKMGKQKGGKVKTFQLHHQHQQTWRRQKEMESLRLMVSSKTHGIREPEAHTSLPAGITNVSVILLLKLFSPSPLTLPFSL